MIPVMADTGDAELLFAATLLRGDLPDLLPEGWEQVDAALCEALTAGGADPALVAERVQLVVAFDSGLAARLRSYQNLGPEHVFHAVEERGADVGFNPLPGKPGQINSLVWVCPEEHRTPIRRRQRFPDQDMGQCPIHHVDLVVEGVLE